MVEVIHLTVVDEGHVVAVAVSESIKLNGLPDVVSIVAAYALNRSKKIRIEPVQDKVQSAFEHVAAGIACL